MDFAQISGLFKAFEECFHVVSRGESALKIIRKKRISRIREGRHRP